MDLIKKNYFELFDLPSSFEVDLDVLREKYRDLQRVIHPDKFVNSSDREKMLSVQHAALINDAFNTLKSPLLRARYLLELQGVTLDDTSNTAMDPMFLMDQMELREALGDVKAAAKPVDAIGDLIDDIDSRSRQLISELKTLFAAGGDAQKQLAAQATRKLQFMDKLRQEADAIEAELDD